ncbi:MAG: polysaccharide biosynthesis/export family protein [Chitinophagaceae bacterium]|nr:polysaccharide biosynthesis/export family protein [Chitinophagaceae bacterium]
MKLIRLLLLLVFPLYFISCSTQQRIPNYIENITDSSDKAEIKVEELRIQKNDLLSIQIYSTSIRADVDDLYNLRTTGGSAGSNGQGMGFLVDAKGNIEHPRLGVFHAEGLTKDELTMQIKKKLTEPVELLKDPTVIIRFLNLKITVMGEVTNQGVMNIPGEKVTILEAVGLAGGITEWGLKDQVKVIREVDGKRMIGQVNLASDSLFQSPFYNLMQNDVVLVQPTKRKAKKAEQDVVLQRVGFGLSVITAIALLYNIFR